MKRVLVLVGPKGAGKTTIGHLLESEAGIPFVRVEPLFLAVRAALGPGHPDFEREGFRAVGEALVAALARRDTVCFESTGASPLFAGLLDELSGHALVLPVQVVAGPARCLERVRSRDGTLHIPVSDERVAEINAVAERLELPWAARIGNDAPLEKDAILGAIGRLLGR